MWARNIKSSKPDARRPASPTEPRPPAHYLRMVPGAGFEPAKPSQAAVLQTAGFSHSPTPARQQLQGTRGREQGLCSLSLVPMPPVWSPRGDSNPLTYRLQVGCATIAPLGPGRPSPPPAAPLTGRNKIRPPTRRGDGDCSIEATSAKVNVVLCGDQDIPYTCYLLWGTGCFWTSTFVEPAVSPPLLAVQKAQTQKVPEHLDRHQRPQAHVGASDVVPTNRHLLHS